MYYIKWKSSNRFVSVSGFFLSTIEDGWTTWSSLNKAKNFASKQEALEAVKSGRDRVWTSESEIVFIHPFNLL